MFASGPFSTRGLDRIDLTGVDFATLTVAESPVAIEESILEGLTYDSLDEFMANREEISKLTTERLPTGIRGWLGRLFVR